MNTEHDTTAVVSYLQERDAERRKSRRFWIILTIAIAAVGGLVYSVQRDRNAENQQHRQNVRDYTCAISGRDC